MVAHVWTLPHVPEDLPFPCSSRVSDYSALIKIIWGGKNNQNTSGVKSVYSKTTTRTSPPQRVRVFYFLYFLTGFCFFFLFLMSLHSLSCRSGGDERWTGKKTDQNTCARRFGGLFPYLCINNNNILPLLNYYRIVVRK